MAKLYEEQQLLLSSQAATPDNGDKVTASVSVNLLESISTTALTWNRPTAASICQSHQTTPMTGRSGIRMQAKNVAMSQLQRNNKPQWNHGARRRQRTRQGHKLTSVWVLGCLNVLRKKWQAETLLTLGQILNEWYAQESAKETWGDLTLTLSLTCCRCQFLVYSITVMLLPLLHLAGQINGLHWSIYL